MLLTRLSTTLPAPAKTLRTITAAACALLLFAACQPADQKADADTAAPEAQEHAAHTNSAEHTAADATATEAAANTQEQAATDTASDSTATSALLKIEQPWIRAAVEGQSGTGGFMKITPEQDLELVGFSTDLAEVNELHEMVMDGEVMKMSAIPSLPLPAGETTELKPGSYHLMLMKLKQPLKDGDTVQLTLMVKDSNAVVSTFPVTAAVKTSDGEHHDMHHDHHDHDHDDHADGQEHEHSDDMHTGK